MTGRGTWTAAAILLVTCATACTAATVTPTPATPPDATATFMATPTGPAPTPTATPSPTTQSAASADPSPTAEPTDSDEPTDSPTPPLPTGPLPNLGAVPSGTWTGLDWIAVPGGHAPAVTPPNDESPGPDATIAGWSKGFVEFVWSPSARTLTPWVSGDGLRWKSGKRLDTSAWKSEFADYDAGNVPDDQGVTDPLFHDACSFFMDNFQEGPNGVLLVGDVSCGGGCGGPWYDTTPLTWTSPDGLTWAVLDEQPFGSGGIGNIAGGGNGFVALGSSGSGAIWTSQDGRSWSKGLKLVLLTMLEK